MAFHHIELDGRPAIHRPRPQRQPPGPMSVSAMHPNAHSRPSGRTLSQALSWIRIGLLCLVGVSNSSLGQPAAPSTCATSEVVPRDGLFALRVGDKSIGLATTAEALQESRELQFAAIVVPSAMQASMPPIAREGSAPFMQAVPARSGSALVRGDLPLSVESVDANHLSVSLVVYSPPGGGAHPVAAMVVDSSQWRTTRVMLTWLSLPASVRSANGLGLARDEHLYTLAFRQVADALFCTSSANGGCEGAHVLSQSEALQRLALHRECLLAAQPESGRADMPRWRVVNLDPAEVQPGPNARVSARVFSQDVPLAGAQIMFSRLPHSACTATTQTDGVATCELADTYGHGGGHPEFDRAPVQVTFPGDLRRDPILLPTTRLMATDRQSLLSR